MNIFQKIKRKLRRVLDRIFAPFEQRIINAIDKKLEITENLAYQVNHQFELSRLHAHQLNCEVLDYLKKKKNEPISDDILNHLNHHIDHSLRGTLGGIVAGTVSYEFENITHTLNRLQKKSSTYFLKQFGPENQIEQIAVLDTFKKLLPFAAVSYAKKVIRFNNKNYVFLSESIPHNLLVIENLRIHKSKDSSQIFSIQEFSNLQEMKNSLQDLIKSSRHDGRAVIMLVEGFEGLRLLNMLKESLKDISQLVLQMSRLEGLADPNFLFRFNEGVNLLFEHFKPVHLGSSNRDGIVCVANVAVPRTIKISFANLNNYTFDYASADRDPKSLVESDDPEEPEIYMSHFLHRNT